MTVIKNEQDQGIGVPEFILIGNNIEIPVTLVYRGWDNGGTWEIQDAINGQFNFMITRGGDRDSLPTTIQLPLQITDSNGTTGNFVKVNNDVFNQSYHSIFDTLTFEVDANEN